MPDRVIDCCSLLNLFTGWGGLAELRSLQRTWHICEAAISESEYTREFTVHGDVVNVPLNMAALISSGLLHSVRPETQAELNDYVEFAIEIDDGEAQSLAIAKHRGFTLLTDDRKALQIAQRAEINVPTISTVVVLREWAQLDPQNEARLRAVVERISVLAKFGPRVGSIEHDWWIRYLKGPEN